MAHAGANGPGPYRLAEELVGLGEQDAADYVRTLYAEGREVRYARVTGGEDRRRIRAAITYHFGIRATEELPWWEERMYLEFLHELAPDRDDEEL